MAGLSFAAIDVETANSARGSICAVGVTVVRGGERVASESWLCRPPEGLEFFAWHNIRVHGISAAMVAGQPAFAERWPTIAELVGGLPVVAHNAGFDSGAVREACVRSGIHAPAWDFSCSLALARRHLDLDSYRLPNVAEALGIDFTNHHDAGADAAAAAEIVLALAARTGADSLAALGRMAATTARTARAAGVMLRPGRDSGGSPTKARRGGSERWSSGEGIGTWGSESATPLSAGNWQQEAENPARLDDLPLRAGNPPRLDDLPLRAGNPTLLPGSGSASEYGTRQAAEANSGGGGARSRTGNPTPLPGWGSAPGYGARRAADAEPKGGGARARTRRAVQWQPGAASGAGSGQPPQLDEASNAASAGPRRLDATAEAHGEPNRRRSWFGREELVVPEVTGTDPSHPLFGEIIVFTGDLAGMTRQEAWDAIAACGAQPARNVTRKTTRLVIGDGFRGADPAAFVTTKAKRVVELRERGQRIEVMDEVAFLASLGDRG
ncbi:hypothetical protein D7D52_18480 [Nocardia yunnanensis]|uniref:Exonuclease domain-containing protein n=1 Tax=Nocardia yunnanensis TaxID=2382165 RepID=A0A386ZDE6_9NOCA|nr:exonuclease domain-containing protein [Nocardia yunnanensis]AYF75508.1 hypothetical protein D7D52_18480 [Nocardia yunnanensis]